MESLQMLKYDFKKKRLDFSKHAVVNQWDLMDDPDEPVDVGRTGLQGKDGRDTIEKLINAFQREEDALMELI